MKKVSSFVLSKFDKEPTDTLHIFKCQDIVDISTENFTTQLLYNDIKNVDNIID
jgi:hypothetical protein